MNRPSIPDVLERFRAYYRLHPVGGVFYITLENGNVKDGHAMECWRRAHEEGDPEAIELAVILLQMTPTQRKKLGTLMP
jgi:MOSC domain-containing protein YiiM